MCGKVDGLLATLAGLGLCELEKHAPNPGTLSQTLKGNFGELPIEVPRDRNGTFISKRQARCGCFTFPNNLYRAVFGRQRVRRIGD